MKILKLNRRHLIKYLIISVLFFFEGIFITYMLLTNLGPSSLFSVAIMTMILISITVTEMSHSYCREISIDEEHISIKTLLNKKIVIAIDDIDYVGNGIKTYKHINDNFYNECMDVYLKNGKIYKLNFKLFIYSDTSIIRKYFSPFNEIKNKKVIDYLGNSENKKVFSQKYTKNKYVFKSKITYYFEICFFIAGLLCMGAFVSEAGKIIYTVLLCVGFCYSIFNEHDRLIFCIDKKIILRKKLIFITVQKVSTEKLIKVMVQNNVLTRIYFFPNSSASDFIELKNFREKDILEILEIIPIISNKEIIFDLYGKEYIG